MGYTNSSLESYTKLSPDREPIPSTASRHTAWSVSYLLRASADALPALLVRLPATMASALTDESPYVLKRKTVAGAPLLMPMTKEPSPSNVPLTGRSLMR